MAATIKSTRRTSGGRSAVSDKRGSASRRAGEGDETGGGRRREAATGARKPASGARKAAGRKTAAKKAAPAGSRKTTAKASGGRGRKAGGARAAEDKRTSGSGTARGARKAASRKSAPSRGPRTGKATGEGNMDALSLLKQDHEHVNDLLRKFERMKEGDDRKQALLQEILDEVRVHAQVEEELFYPALRTVLEQDGKEKEIKLIAEADVEHETVKWLMAELEGGALQDEMVDARVKVMGEYIRHHVEEEEGPIFRAAKRSDLDLEELGRQIDARKRELKGETGESDEEGMAGTGMQGGVDSGAARAVPPGTH